MTNSKILIKKFAKIFAIYGVQIWLILFVSNVAVITFIRYKAQAQTCMTQAQINADSRCLYILSGNIYNKGSRSNPHHGHPCGMDVTSIIPSFHTNSANRYLLPNFVAPLCTGTNPTPTPAPTATPRPTPTPTVHPTPTPTPRPTTAPTQAPTAQPTQAPTAQPTQRPTSQPTTQPTQAPTAQPTQQAYRTATPAPNRTAAPTLIAKKVTPTPTSIPDTPTPSPQPTSMLFAIMAQLAAAQTPTPTPIATGDFSITATTVPGASGAPIAATSNKDQLTYLLIYWSTMLSYGTFLVLLGVAGYWLIEKIKARMKEQQTFKEAPKS